MRGLKSLTNLFGSTKDSNVLTPDELESKIRLIKMAHPFRKIVVVNGCFDLLHAGHASMLSHAKRFGSGSNFLVVGLNSDRAITDLKGPSRPVVSEKARLFVVRQLKSVDFAFVFDSTDFSPYLNACGQCVFVKGEDYKEITTKELAVLERNGGYWSTVGSDFNLTTTQICEKIRK